MSAAAYCVGAMAHISASKLQRKIRRRVSGAKYVSLRASSWAKYVGFCQQIKDAAIGRSGVFDSLVLLGGRKDDAPPNDYIRGMAKVIAEIWSDPFTPYLGTSDGRFIYDRSQSPRIKNNKPARCDVAAAYLSGKRGVRKRNKSLTDLLRATLVPPAQDSCAADTLFARISYQLPNYNASAYLADWEDVYKCSEDEGDVGGVSTALRDMRRGFFRSPKLRGACRKKDCIIVHSSGGDGR